MDEGKFWIIGLATIAITLIGCLTYYNYQRDQAMKSNIESAIVKGIDPIAIRCAYVSNLDNICMVYAAVKK
jgi:hypothetical protein